MVTLLQIPRGSRFEGGAFEDGNLWVDSRGSFHVLCHVYRSEVRLPRDTCPVELEKKAIRRFPKISQSPRRL